MIEVREIRKSYGQNEALRDVSFSVAKGEIVGLVGRNGAGKSTTMNIISGYLASDGGSVAINGHDIGEEAVAALQRWFQIHEILLVQPRPEGEVRANYPLASMFRGYEDGRVKWRRVEDDEVAFMFARQLGRDMVDLMEKLA